MREWISKHNPCDLGAICLKRQTAPAVGHQNVFEDSKENPSPTCWIGEGAEQKKRETKKETREEVVKKRMKAKAAGQTNLGMALG